MHWAVQHLPTIANQCLHLVASAWDEGSEVCCMLQELKAGIVYLSRARDICVCHAHQLNRWPAHHSENQAVIRSEMQGAIRFYSQVTCDRCKHK